MPNRHEPPNVLVIMCDQLRYDALSCHGNTEIETPNMDRLAAKSVCFRRAYNQSPLCGPTRHSLATGLYPHQHGVLNNILLPFDPMYTVAHALAELNYRRYCFGHMHWQRLPVPGDDDVFTDTGYEEYFASDDMALIPPEKLAMRLWEKTDLTKGYASGPSILDPHEFWGAQTLVESSQKLEELTASGERFLCWSSFQEPHPPFFPPAAYYGGIRQESLSLPIELPPDAPPPHPSFEDVDPRWRMFTKYEKRRMKAAYYGLVRLADDYVGELLGVMDRLKLWDNTMVIFTVDHGEQMGDHGRYFKSVMREPCVHVPLMVCHPDYQPGVRDQLVEHVDVFPTICDAVGATIPQNVAGCSLLPLLEKDEVPDNWREYVFAQLDRTLMIRTADWKLNIYDQEPGELFNLRTDPCEVDNLLGLSRTRQRYRDRVEWLSSLVLDQHPNLYHESERIFQSGRHRKRKQKPKIQMAATH